MLCSRNIRSVLYLAHSTLYCNGWFHGLNQGLVNCGLWPMNQILFLPMSANKTLLEHSHIYLCGSFYTGKVESLRQIPLCPTKAKLFTV